MRLLIRGVRVYDGPCREDSACDILIEDGLIVEVLPRCTREADKTIDGTDKVAIPSFINGHTHAAMTLFRGFADDMPLKRWLEEKIWVLEAKLTEEDVYWGTKLACLEMIKNGITVFNDMYWFFEGTARAVQEMGLRAILSGVFIDLFDPAKRDEQIRLNTDLLHVAQKYEPHVRFALGPHGIYTVSRESLHWIRDFAEKNDLLIHMHLSETEQEVQFSKERYGRLPGEFLYEEGLLSSRFIGAHGCWLTDGEMQLLGRTNAHLVHNPVSNLKLAVGRFFPYRDAQDRGVSYCLGTDGCSSNNHLDMVETMKLAALLGKFATNDPTFLSAAQVLALATEKAAAIFGLGSWKIEAGERTDIVLVDMKRPEFVPNFDFCSDIVYAANGYAIDTVICMGQVLMENRQVTGEETIMERARQVARRLSEK
jgi:5-methylthioadenosine/S-adenosylhomocysteine deaminase